MDQNHDYEQNCTRYLLGELTEAEQARFEEAYFVDDLLFERFLAVKDELIDSYARHEMGDAERERFERHFLATLPRRERVNSAREFIRAVSARASLESEKVATTSQRNSGPSARESWRRLFDFGRLVPQAALAVLLLIALGGTLIFLKRAQRERAAQLERESVARNQTALNSGPVAPAPTSGQNMGGQPGPVVNSQSTPTASPDSPSPNTNKQSPPTQVQVATLSLLPFSSRAGDSAAASLKLGPETRLVRLSLIFKDDDHRNYEITVRTVAGEQVALRRRLKALSSDGGKHVTFTLDPSIFRGQDYIITLNGIAPDGKLEAINDYYLKVERTPLN